LKLDLPGPVGEANTYSLRPKGPVLCVPATEFGLLVQVGAALATGNAARVFAPSASLAGFADALPAELRPSVAIVGSRTASGCVAALFEGGSESLRGLVHEVAELHGPIRPVFAVMPDPLRVGTEDYPLEFLLEERSVSTNTAAAGGNASLMAIG
jgi:RHH-type proline utilization regulon transcriptional repressor/proline dehydrogenase/delta 1-pyrroline-5-carboxylate dehydrogenase